VDNPAGRIITYYSYKGGTGRTMALANTAWVLASNGYRVLMVDWDLEAPGLHRYFHPFLTDKTLSDTRGMIDLVFDYQRTVLALPESEGARRLPAEWYDEHVNIFPYITELVWPQPGFGELHLLPAGRQNSDYGKRVNTFNWSQLYENLGGFELFEAMKRRFAKEYDYVLVDSRTGVSDTSGISTVQMPDTLVVCFTLNAQSIEGAGEVALSVVEQRAKEYADGSFRIMPVPTRLEKAEKQKLDLARNAARAKFDTFLAQLSPMDRDRYWGEVEMFYEPFYAYEEVLAAFADKPGAISSLLASIERLTARLTLDKVKSMKPLQAARREEILAAYERRAAVQSDPATHAAAVFRRLGAQDEETARIILLRLISAGPGGTAFRKAMATDVFSERHRSIVNRLVDEGLLNRKLAEGEDTDYVSIADDRLIESWPALRGWIEEYRGQLLLCDDIERRASKWDAAGRPGDLLLGTREMPDSAWFKPDTELITPLAQLFLKESRQRATARRWLVRGAEILAAMAVLAYLIQGYAWPRISRFTILHSVQTKLGPVDGQQYVWIKAGSFDMGCPSDMPNSYDCRPQTHVTLTSGFWMGQTEATNSAYRSYLRARHPDQLAARTQPDRDPVNNVAWPDAVEYCAWAGGRLPSLAEWEYAARAGVSGQLYATGNSLRRDEIGVDTLHPVGSFPPNRFGLFDMSGNVEEWSDDVPYYNSDGTPAKDPHNNPLMVLSLRGSPANPYYRWYPGVGIWAMPLRGGSYDSSNRGLRLDVIDDQPFNPMDPRIGFRCVIPASELEKVASNYQPFSSLYGEYSNPYRSYFDPYRAWWYTIYLRFMENAGAP
jgi:formylglycine-generating enzyme required for sulfatase activity/MinD-like ATPase involved in chromosome partitioning or flagellar assembly